MKGIFIPEITEEMFRNGCLESIETLMAEGKIYDIEYPLDKEQKTEWIPVSERMPKEMESVLTTIQTSPKRINVRSGSYYHGCFHNDNGDVWLNTDKEVKAWMPSPKPYKESEV